MGGHAFPELLREREDLSKCFKIGRTLANAAYRLSLLVRSSLSLSCVRRRLQSIRCFTQVPLRDLRAAKGERVFTLSSFRLYRDKYRVEQSLASAGCGVWFLAASLAL